MLKRFFNLLILTLLFSTTHLKAFECSDSRVVLHSGFYSGIAMGYSAMKSRNTDGYLIPGGAFSGSDSKVTQSNGVGGDFFLGYRYIFSNGLVTGLDLALSWDSNKAKHTNTFGAFINETQMQASAKFIPGIVIGKRFLDRFLASIKLGGSFTQFRGYHALRIPPDTLSETFKVRKVGCYISTGLEVALTNNISTIALVSYENYGKIKKNLTEKLNVVPGEESQIVMKPRYVTAKIGLVLHFN